MANAISSLNIDNKLCSFTLPYGVCSTAADTAAKTVTVPNFSLEAGATVIVKFTNANSVASPTLNVNSTGAKSIMRYGTTTASTGTTTTGWVAGAVQMFTYDGTNWIRDYWNNTIYSNFVKSGSSAKAGLVPKPSTTAGTTKYLREDGTWQIPPDTDTVYTLPNATSSTLGGVKIGSNITVSSGTISLTKANVTAALGYTPPTSDTNTTYSQATSSTLGLVKIGYTESGKNYPVELNSSGQMYVNVPWTDTDTNTTYSAGTGISLSGTTFSNSGVRSIATGSSNGTISVNTNGTSADVSVKGLAAAAYKAVTDSTSASAISTGTSLVTERDVYYGLANINNARQTSSVSVYAPTAGGTTTQVLMGNGTTSAPVWVNRNQVTATLYNNTTTASASLEFVTGTTLSFVPDKKGYTYNMGAADNRWGTINATSGDFSGNVAVGGTLGVTGITTVAARIQPNADNNINLGYNNLKWLNVYCQKSAMSTSDLNAKRDLKEIDDRYIELFDLVQPYAYMFSKGDRVHTGFIAQYIEEAMDKVGITAEELGFFCKDIKTEAIFDENGNYIGEKEIYDENGNLMYSYSLRYEEYIAIMTEKVKRLESKYNSKIEELEKRLEALEA